MIVAIASGVTQTLIAEASRANPHEACGLLLGNDRRIETAIPAKNISDHPERAFEIDPATLLRTHREARGCGQRVVGHYHSHPNGQTEPSLRDAAHAVENGQFWLIVANGQVNAWRVVSNDPGGSAVHGRFLPVSLESDPG
jgi:proteasome lid subunit RPN8/RPN11